MKIVVLTKAAVPNVSTVKIDPKTGTLVREGVPVHANPFDREAVEFALRLKDRYGGYVIAMSMAPPSGKDALETLIGMGVDEAYLISDRVFAGADTLATAYTLSSAIKQLAPDFDLIVVGEETTDSTTAHIGAQVASWLEIPYVYYVFEGELVDEKVIRVKRYLEDDGLVETYELELPALVSVLKGSLVPREVKLVRKVVARANGLVKVVTNKELNLPVDCVGLRGSPTTVVNVHSAKPIPRKMEIFRGGPVEAARWLVGKLKEEGLL